MSDDFSDGGPPSEFERTPPQDLPAEQSVLGGMMLSKDAIADVVEVLRGGDFYRPAHQMIFDAIIDLYGRGEPADAVTVAAELTKRGEVGRVGGAPYLHTLLSSVPTAANAGYYAQIVRERAVLRRLVEAGTRIVQMGYAADGDVDDIVNSAQAEVYAVTEQRTSEDYAPLAAIMEGALDEIEAISSRGDAMIGIPTGFADLDSLTNGLHPGQMIVVAARPAIGKALALDTPLPTPAGWTTMGEVRVGDALIGADGRPTTVLAATEVMRGRPCYAVEFSDGSAIVADADHLWVTSTRASRSHTPSAAADAKTTRQIAATSRCAVDGRPNHAVALAAPLDLPERELPLPPYTLGAWLGGGEPDAALPAETPAEVLLRLHADGTPTEPAPDGRRRLPTAEPLREQGLLDGRHIPGSYLRAGTAQRRALLAGLLDVAGYPGHDGRVRLSVRGERLARDMRELVHTLGYRAAPVKPASPAGQDAGGADDSLVVTFFAADKVFELPEKLARQSTSVRPAMRARHIVAARPIPSQPVRCVRVDAPDHLYLAGESMIPTHNSTLGLDFARSCSIKNGLTSVIFSLEMSRNEITMRLLSAEARVALHHMRSGSMTDDDWTRLARRMGEVSAAPLFIDDSPNMSMMEIRAKCRRLKQRNDLRLVIVDYLQLMQSGGSRRVESRQQEVSDISRSLKLLAKELDVPVIAISQLNRGPEQRTDKKPMVSDLRESGCMTADTTLLRADTGAPITFGQLMAGGHDGVSVWSLDERQRLVAAPIVNVFASGVKGVFRLRLASGRQVKASGNHKFLTFDGWTRLDELVAGDRVAIPRHVPAPMAAGLGWSEHRLGLLAHLIGDGCVAPKQPAHDPSEDEQVWLAELGIKNLRSHQKRIPDALYQASDAEVATFLRRLWATDGCVVEPSSTASGIPAITYSTSSRALADGVATLLGRLGIICRIDTVAQGSRRPAYRLALASDLPQGATPSDVLWDRVVAIEPVGAEPTYDATVKGTHNFIADGVVAHNSIEQDADMVVLLHREDAYERESPRAGEADLIVAKHRNGPTATITVAFQGHYSRFVDMAQS